MSEHHHARRHHRHSGKLDASTILALLCAAAALVFLMIGCAPPQQLRVVKVLTCTTGGSWGYTPKCRVLANDGGTSPTVRITATAPVAEGDIVVWGPDYWRTLP